MNTVGLWLVLAVLWWMGASSTLAADALIAPVVPAGVASSEAFTAAVNGQPLGVYARSAESRSAFAAFSSGNWPVKVTLTHARPIRSAVVRPLSRQVTPRIDGRSLSFDLAGPGYFVVEIADAPPLFLFADAAEATPPDPKGPNVVYFGPGLHDAPAEELRLQSGQTLYLAPGAVLVRKALMIRDARDVVVRGRGVLIAPIRVYQSQQVLIEGIIVAPPAKTWMNRLMAARHVTFRNFKAISQDDNWNNDGVDIMSACNHITVEDSFIRANDDVIALKHHPHDAAHWFTKEPISHITFRRNVVGNVNGGNVFEIGVETIGTSIGNLTFSDCDVFISSNGGGAVFDIAAPDQALIHDVLYEKIRVERYSGKLIDLHRDHPRYRVGQTRGQTRGLYFRDITAVAGDKRNEIIGVDPQHGFDGVHFDNVRIDGRAVSSLADLNCKVEHAANIAFNQNAVRPTDTAPPALMGAAALSAGERSVVYLRFSEQIDTDAANDASHYAFSPAIKVHSAAVDPSQRQVVLMTDAIAADVNLTVTAKGVKDLSGNVVQPDQPQAVSVRQAWKASADFAGVQGTNGWWFEQFNRQPVQTYTGRPDLMQQPTYSLMSTQPPKQTTWIGHDVDASVVAGGQTAGKRFDAVRTWRAPAAGKARVSGKVASRDNGLTARVVHHPTTKNTTDATAKPIWQSPPLTAEPQSHDLTVDLLAGESIRFVVGANQGSADWDPQITFQATPD